MSFRTLVATALCVLAVPAVAAADDFPTDHPVDNATTRAYLRAATAFWGTNPCPDGAQLFQAQLYSAGTGGGAVARTSADPIHHCQMILAPLYKPTYDDEIRQCSEASHEVGHWLGFEHTDDLHSIMFGGKIYDDGSYGNIPTVKACYKRFKPACVTPKRDRAMYGERIWAQHPLIAPTG